ncbi:MAG: cation:dicarboxylase symporter family transporter [Clostridia bacterium]|nr:cation:dicarboxylase symporter family transporter [Clostridia bacterium]
MKIENKRSEYDLNAEAIDDIAEQIETFLYSLETQRANVLRVRLTMEEALIRWQARFGEEAKVSFSKGSRWRRPYISLEMEGERYDPLSDTADELGRWTENLLSEVGLIPQYSYQQGINTLQLSLRRPQMNPAITLVIALGIGLAVGIIGAYIFPEHIRAMLINTTLDPIQSLFFRIMNAVSGPVIFFTVLVGIIGVGSIAAGGKTGRRMLLRFIASTTALTMVSLYLSTLAFSISHYNAPMNETRFTGVLDFFLKFVPNDIISPLISGETPQLILVAVIVGNALLAAGSRADGLTAVLKQINNVGLIITDWVGRLSPFFIVILLILGLWSRSLDALIGCWKPILLVLAMTAVSIFVWAVRICATKGIGLNKLFKKLRPSFLVALKTASVDAAFGDNLICCEKKLGIPERFSRYSLSFGLVVFMPIGTVTTMIFTMYTAKSYGIVITPVWCITAVVMTVALLIATPPVAGIGLLAYAGVFAQLGIPSSGLTIALMADVLFGFVTAAANQVMLQMELVLYTDRMGILNRNILQK